MGEKSQVASQWAIASAAAAWKVMLTKSGSMSHSQVDDQIFCETWPGHVRGCYGVAAKISFSMLFLSVIMDSDGFHS